MAIINIELENQNLEPVNGEYTFTVTFHNALTDALLNDSRFPQNQVFTFNSITNPLLIPLEIANGSYTINNVKIKVEYKSEVISYTLPPTTVNCIDNCTVFPITGVTKVNNTTYTVGLTSASTQTLSWKVLSTTLVTIASGVANVVNTTFNITTPSLGTGDYMLELTGSTCKGKNIKAFSVVNSLPACQYGPNLVSILSKSSTSLQFQFDGLSIFGITWRIKQGSSVIRNGVLKHASIAQPGEATFNSSTPTISYGSLTTGSFTLEIEGSECLSTPSTLAFTIDPTEQLAFISGFPAVTGSAGNYTISIKINKTATYNTVVLNTTTGTYSQNGDVAYTAGTTYAKTGLPVGQYYIKVGTLESNVTIQNTGGSGCVQGPTLGNIISASTSGLQFLFDGIQITAITWRIKQGGTTVRNGVVFPTSNSPFISYSELPEGTYTFEIEGNNCSSAVSSAVFEVVNVPQGNNAGVIVTTVGNKYIGIINGRSLKAVANPTTGAIRVFYDEISQAEGNSSRQVKGWLLRDQLNEIKASELTALRSTSGLVLPDGNYHFYLYYFPTDTVQTFSQIRANLGPLLQEFTWNQYTRTLEELIIEVKSNISI